LDCDPHRWGEVNGDGEVGGTPLSPTPQVGEAQRVRNGAIPLSPAWERGSGRAEEQWLRD